MHDSRVLSDIFIGREKELTRFRELLEPSCKTHVLSIHTNGLSGIGKTQLMLQMRNICAEMSKNVIFAHRIIDFYHTEARLKTDIMRIISTELGAVNFPTFTKTLKSYYKTDDSSQRQTLFGDIERNFISDYQKFSKKSKEVIVLFFDTYEMIQKFEFSGWLESNFFPMLNNNTRIIVAGRHKLQTCSAETMLLEPFRLNDTIEFWEKCFRVSSIQELILKIGPKDIIEKMHQYAKGHPVLLALFADWCMYQHNPLDPAELEKTIRDRVAADPSLSEEDLFETALIERIASMREPENHAIKYMAIANRRMTSEMFSHISEKSIEESENVLFKRLRSLSYIKYKKEHDTVLLHDEMRDLIIKHLWNKQDPTQMIAKNDIFKRVIEYYDIIIDRSDIDEFKKVVFQSERLHYQLLLDPDIGYASFAKLFDQYISDYRIYFCNLIAWEVIPDLYFNVLSPNQKLETIVKRLRWRNEQYLSRDVLVLTGELDDETIKIKDETITRDAEIIKSFMTDIEANINNQTYIPKDGQLLYAYVNHEKGRAFMWLNLFDDAKNSFLKAEKMFRRLDHRYRSAWELNMLGYAFLRNGDFVSSEKKFIKSANEILNQLDRKQEYKDINIRLPNIYSNLNVALRYQGRFYEALIYGEIAAATAKKKQKKRELARFFHSLGETYMLTNNIFDASIMFEEAIGILDDRPDPLLKARVLIGQAKVHYRYPDYIHILEYYLRNDRKNALLGFKGEPYPSREGLKKAGICLKDAKDILKKEINQSTSEFADLLFYTAEYHTIRDHWDQAGELFIESEKVAEDVNNEYRKIDACVCQIICHYFQGKYESDEKVMDCINRVEKAKNTYHNLLGKMEIFRGNFAYDRYLKTKAEKDIKESIRRYVIACDHMYSFSRVSLDRFYATFRILVKRIGDLSCDMMPSLSTLESLRDIWNYDESEREVCQVLSHRFDEIVDFFHKAAKLTQREDRENFAKKIEEKIGRHINIGKEEARFAPIYGEMLYHLQKDHGSRNEMANVYFTIARAYEVNDNIFEADKNIRLAFDCIDKTEDSPLKARILIRYGRILYRRGEYAKTLEFYRKSDFASVVDNYIIKNKKNISQAIDQFKAADKILKRFESKADDNAIAYIQAHLEFRWAECLLLTKGDEREIEKRFKDAIEKAKISNNHWRHIDAIQSLITFYYFSDQWENRLPEVLMLREEFERLNAKHYYPALKGRLQITFGNVHYDRLFNDPNNAEQLEHAFSHYIVATRCKMEYSEKLFFDSVITLIDRIVNLPYECSRLLNDIYPKIQNKRPTGPIADESFKLVEQCILYHSEIL